MILCLKTDSKVAYVALRSDAGIVSEHSWEAHRELSDTLLKVIESELSKHDSDWSGLSGIIFYKGPGSFTGLRIGVTVANTLADAQNVPIVGETGDTWMDDGMVRLQAKDNDQIVLPEYGGEANITKPRK